MTAVPRTTQNRPPGNWAHDGVGHHQTVTKQTGSSPLHMVPKKTPGDWRPCSEFCSLNSAIIPDQYPIPHIQDFATTLHGATIFSKLDLVCAYSTHHSKLPIRVPFNGRSRWTNGKSTHNARDFNGHRKICKRVVTVPFNFHFRFVQIIPFHSNHSVPFHSNYSVSIIAFQFRVCCAHAPFLYVQHL